MTLILGFISIPCLAQEPYALKGLVLSGGKEPVPNVSISIEGSSQLPVVTDTTGEFSIDTISANDWIIVSPTGNYKRKRIFLNRRESLKIYLTTDDIPSGDDPLNIMAEPVPRR
ncbi:MAG: hypothetical protein KAT15_07845, partial [Bacteroidales bacterium]|nr:hypothetical protein [Bacteroidales bacterium]